MAQVGELRGVFRVERVFGPVTGVFEGERAILQPTDNFREYQGVEIPDGASLEFVASDNRDVIVGLMTRGDGVHKYESTWRPEESGSPVVPMLLELKLDHELYGLVFSVT